MLGDPRSCRLGHITGPICATANGRKAIRKPRGIGDRAVQGGVLVSRNVIGPGLRRRARTLADMVGYQVLPTSHSIPAYLAVLYGL